ncbi:MAG: CRISPR-associated endonuclease Cas1 [Thermoprotei archaeon]|nr:MAG: CRISPR-associated endonuclease Cas1 [Thermoprotei archaeon]
MTKIALIDRYGAFLSAKEGRFQLYVKSERIWDVAPVELEAIVFTIPGASISAAAVKLANDYGIDIVFMDKGKPLARLVQASYGSTLKTWLHQLKKAHRREERLRLAVAFAEGKIHNQRVVLYEYYKYFKTSGKRYHHIASSVNRLEELLSKLESTSSVDEVRRLEAQAARYYWATVASLLPAEVGFKLRIPRSRQAPGVELDAFNRALNVGYGVLKRAVWRAVFMAGLNPYVSFLHKPRAGKMTLVFDLMEEFRPIAVDRPLIAAFRKNCKQFEGLKNDEREATRAVWKTVANRLYESKPPLNNLILEQARLLARHVRGTCQYKPYKAKW